MGPAIDVRDLKKSFGDFEALKGMSFYVEENEIFGLIGPNGAGKTTTLRILGTLISPSSGSAQVFGNDVVKGADDIRKILSYLPEDAGAYQYLNGEEYLDFMAGFYAHDKAAKRRWSKQGKRSVASGTASRTGSTATAGV